VIESPQAQFSTTNVCLHNQSTFNDLSTPVIGSSITGWNWNFGDGDSSSTQNNSHLYQNAGNYTVLLTITSKEGCYDTISSVVSVYNLPSVNFTNSKACTNSPIQFNDSTTCTSGFPSNWLWDFGTGIQSTLQNPAYTYANAFAYPIKLVVSSNYGCLDSLTKFIIINQSPQFNINANDNCFNTTTNFQSIPVQGSSTNVGYIWNLGDSSYSTNPNPQHIYNAPGSYNINLTVTNLGNSCSTNISDTVKINPLPKAKFLSDSACVNTNLQLTDLSTINGGIINNYKWTIGSYGTSNLQNPIINLAAADSFAVKLLVTSNTGCKDSTTEVIEINPLPTVSFTPNPYFGAPPLDVTFSTTSNNNTNMWDFGDGSNTIIGNGIQHTFNDTGSYTVHLISTTSKGCTDSSDKVITVLIPYTDLSIETINFTKVSDYWQLSARIKNNGNQIISNYILKSRLSEKSPITEVFENDTLNTGQTKNITFKSRFTVDNNDNPGYLCMEVMEVNHGHDENETNNKKCITSTNEFEVFNTYPNPFESDINVDVNIPTKGTVSVKLYNLLGGYLSEPIERNVLKGYNSFTINGSYLQKGIYFLEIRYKDQKSIVKILKY
jgi:PKD repeat protein